MPYGIYCPPIQNAMSKNAFEFLRRYLHFDDNRNKKPHNHPSYDSLWKIRWVLENVMDCMRNAYQPGERITIDESMIRYRGKAAQFLAKQNFSFTKRDLYIPMDDCCPLFLTYSFIL